MDIKKVKVDHLILLACLPTSFSLVWNLEKETPRIYVGLFGNIYFQNLIQN